MGAQIKFAKHAAQTCEAALGGTLRCHPLTNQELISSSHAYRHLDTLKFAPILSKGLRLYKNRGSLF